MLLCVCVIGVQRAGQPREGVQEGRRLAQQVTHRLRSFTHVHGRHFQLEPPICFGIRTITLPGAWTMENRLACHSPISQPLR